MSLRSLVKTWLHRPPGSIGSIGKDSIIFRPRRLDHPECIFVGEHTEINRHSYISALRSYPGNPGKIYTPRITFGDHVFVGHYCCITAIGEITIGDGCVLSEHVYISDQGHGVDPEAGLIMQQPLYEKGPVRIGAHTFLGYRSCVLPGVQLGEHCVVGANAVVTTSFPAYSMVAGVPARLIRRYSMTEKKWITVSGD